MKLKAIGWILGIAALAGTVEAGPIYRCTKPNGTASFQDNPCPDANGTREVFAEAAGSAPVSSGRSGADNIRDYLEFQAKERQDARAAQDRAFSASSRQGTPSLPNSSSIDEQRRRCEIERGSLVRPRQGSEKGPACRSLDFMLSKATGTPIPAEVTVKNYHFPARTDSWVIDQDGRRFKTDGNNNFFDPATGRFCHVMGHQAQCN